MMNFLLSMNQAGGSWEMLIKSMREIQRIIGQAVEVEFKTLFALLMGNSVRRLQPGVAVGGGSAQQLHPGRQKKAAEENNQPPQKNTWNNAYLASTDEGYAAVISDIQPELIALEKMHGCGRGGCPHPERPVHRLQLRWRTQSGRQLPSACVEGLSGQP